MWSLQPGARLDVSSPASLLEIDGSRKSYCLIVGGIGITPIVGIAHAKRRHHAALRRAVAARCRVSR
jgi:dimethylamine monooxygenase subunit B